MRSNVFSFVHRHPMTVEQMWRFGGFQNYKQASVWASGMRNQHRLRPAGTIPNDAGLGRPLDVYCNGWQPKRDHLRHEVKATDYCRLYPEGSFVRGYDVGPFRPDIEMALNGHTYLIEIDCATMTRSQIQRRWQKYKSFDPESGTLIIVAVGDNRRGIASPDREKELLGWSTSMYEIALFTTLERVSEGPWNPVLWDAETGVYRPMKRLENPLEN